MEGGLTDVQVPLEWLNRKVVVHELATVVPTDSRNVAVLCVQVEAVNSTSPVPDIRSKRLLNIHC